MTARQQAIAYVTAQLRLCDGYSGKRVTARRRLLAARLTELTR